MRTFTAALVVSFALSSCKPRVNPALCELAAHRETYANQAVTVEGVLLVTRHGTVISDPQCGAGIAISWRKQDRNLRQLSAMATRSLAKTMLVRVRVGGKVKEVDHFGMVTGGAWIIDLFDARILEAYPISDRDQASFQKWSEGPSAGPFQPTR